MGGHLTQITIPVAVFILMAIVGTGLRTEDFRRVLSYRRAVALGTLGQSILVPVMAAALVAVLAVRPETAAAILIVSLCPGGILSNFYCAIAGKNVALSVTLTAISSLICIVTIPIVGTALLAMAGGRYSSASVPLGIIVTQLTLFLIVPIAIGLILRYLFDRAMHQAQRLLHGAGSVLICLVVALAMWEERNVLLRAIGETALPAIAFTIGALVLGYALAAAFGVAERTVIAIELSVRNIPIAILLGSALHQDAMLSFSVAYFLLHVPIVFGYALLAGRVGGRPAYVRDVD